MKKKYFFIIFLLTISLIYISNITQIPDKIYLIEGEKISIKKVFGINIINQKQDKEVWKDQSSKIEKFSIELLGILKVKEVSVITYPKVKVIPAGNLIGLKLYTSGVLVIGTTEIKNDKNEIEKPFEKSGIKEGDIIIELSGEKINTTSNLKNIVNNSKGTTINIKYIRNNEIFESEITPTKISENEYKLGMWVRDSASGVGTMSFYDNKTKKFAALGHGISDSDTEKLLNIEKGEIVNSKIVNITKGKNGMPGEIRGSITNESNLGNIEKNTNFGIYGELIDTPATLEKYNEGIEIALRSEIQKGKASILTNIEENKAEEFDIEILEIYTENDINNKSMKIKVTDKKLLEKTGGIVCGMSGSPIIQNNKIIGVLTNVLVSNPQIGYGVFADIMIKEMVK